MNARSAKNFSISCARTRPSSLTKTLGLCLLILALVATPATAKKKKKKQKKPTDPVELFNPLLGLDYSHWLVGPIVDIATLEEVEAYLALVTDEEALAFIDKFWASRSEGMGFFEKKPIQIFQDRGAEADKRYSEGEIPGSKTDRGKIFILYGEPSETEYQVPREVGTPSIEAWTYGKDVVEGLDGKKPKAQYRFVEIDGVKMFYTNQKRRPGHFDRLERQRRSDGSGGE